MHDNPENQSMRVPTWIKRATKTLPYLEVRVLLVLFEYADWNTGVAWQRTAASIAGELGLDDPNHVRKAIRKLRERGALVECMDAASGKEVAAWRIQEPSTEGATARGENAKARDSHRAETAQGGNGPRAETAQGVGPKWPRGQGGNGPGGWGGNGPNSISILDRSFSQSILDPDRTTSGELALVAATTAPAANDPPAPPAPRRKARGPAADDPEALRIFRVWADGVGSDAKFATWCDLVANRIAKFGADVVEATIRYCVTDPWWSGRDDRTRTKPPARQLESVLREKNFPGYAERWRTQSRPASVVVSSAPAAMQPAQVDMMAQDLVRAFVAKRGDMHAVTDATPPTADEAARFGFAVLPIGSAVVEGMRCWVWERGEAQPSAFGHSFTPTELLTTRWLIWQAHRYAAKTLHDAHPDDPSVRRWCETRPRDEGKTFAEHMTRAVEAAGEHAA